MIPAFKFVFVFIALLPSDLLKAVRMPIANTPNSTAAGCLERTVGNGDGPLITALVESVEPPHTRGRLSNQIASAKETDS